MSAPAHEHSVSSKAHGSSLHELRRPNGAKNANQAKSGCRSGFGSFFRAEDLESIHANNPTPLYHRLYCVLKRRILSGESEYGEVLPTEASMAEALRVSRITVKRALDNLAAEKLVRRVRAKGSYVDFRRSSSDTGISPAGKLTNLSDLSVRSLVAVLAIERRRPPAAMTEGCFHGLPDGKAFYVARVRKTPEGFPFALHESWSAGVYEGVSAKDLETRPRMEVLLELGLRAVRTTQYLSAASATPDVAERLGLLPDDPVLTLTRHSFDEAGRIVDLLRSQYDPGRFRFCASVDRIAANPAG